MRVETNFNALLLCISEYDLTDPRHFTLFIVMNGKTFELPWYVNDQGNCHVKSWDDFLIDPVHKFSESYFSEYFSEVQGSVELAEFIKYNFFHCNEVVCKALHSSVSANNIPSALSKCYELDFRSEGKVILFRSTGKIFSLYKDVSEWNTSVEYSVFSGNYELAKNKLFNEYVADRNRLFDDFPNLTFPDLTVVEILKLQEEITSLSKQMKIF